MRRGHEIYVTCENNNKGEKKEPMMKKVSKKKITKNHFLIALKNGRDE